MTRPVLLALNLPLCLWIFSSPIAAQSVLVTAPGEGKSIRDGSVAASILDPTLVQGNQSCVKCHAADVQIWKSTPHASTFDLLHRRPEAKQIASKLKLQSIKHEGRCVACHYTQQQPHADAAPEVIAGVSCESCHGESANWLDLHHDYGSPASTRESETAEHREMRLRKSIAAGMRNPSNVYLIAQSCLRCHTTADEELVNVGGHSPGSLDFEFVSWSQGSLRHNFLRSDGQTNQASSQQRLRVMFVAGMIAELEASLRATSVATQRAVYGITAAKRAHRAIQRLQSVAQKVDDPAVNEIVQLAVGIQLKLNHQVALRQAADRVAELGLKFAETNDGLNLQPLDAYIPSSDRWK
ncbi:cytochrome C554 [Roseiconus nitratireducens]|uniref:Cytochrome C554 n=1 Tax=Roseiconus nitratireducens TaxID=2605748 RepID=A0A5M6DCV2_9BACT|nr:cytochrome c family protein [Roseiconus nitratireducens]KAA5545364.1 cytochrome C554 [Roseiconus nitratireducens]